MVNQLKQCFKCGRAQGYNFPIITGWGELIGTEKAEAFVFDTWEKNLHIPTSFWSTTTNWLVGAMTWEFMVFKSQCDW